MLPRSHNLRQISDMHFGVTSDIHNCFDISHNKSAGARRRPTRIAVWDGGSGPKSGKSEEWRSHGVKLLHWVTLSRWFLVSAVEYCCLWTRFRLRCQAAASQVDIMFDICNLAIVNYFRIELQRGWATQEPHSTEQQRSHIRQMLCVVPHPPSHLHSHPHLDVAWFFVSLPCPSGVCCFSAAFEACAVIAAICCPAQQHYLRVLDFCAKRS